LSSSNRQRTVSNPSSNNNNLNVNCLTNQNKSPATLSVNNSNNNNRQSQLNKQFDPFQPLPNKGIYKGSKLFIKHLNIKHLSINREILIELKQLKDLAHENLIRFVGICAEDQHISIMTEYCEKGNLR
ncbi:hypothetical protein BLA29_012982, partial [Euroglyphus maynei]